jgi:hypothetical protein
MTAPALPAAAPDVEAWVWANLKHLPGVTSFAYSGQQIDRGGWLVSTYVQVDARSKRRAVARQTADRARLAVLGLAAADWAEGVVCLVEVVEAPFYLPDDDGLPRYAARYEVRAHPPRRTAA